MSFAVVHRLGRKLSVASTHLTAQRRRFEDTQRVLVQHAAWLKPGDWLPVPPNLTVWHHADATLPDAVVAGGGKAGHWVQNGNGRTALMWKQRLWKLAFAVAGRVRRVPPQATVPRVEARRGHASTAVRPNGWRADLVALEPVQRAVRLGRPGVYDHEYVDARGRYERYLPAPGFTVTDDGAALIEEWCDGQPMRGLPAEQRLVIAIEVLTRYATLITEQATEDEGTVWQALPSLLDQVRLPATLREPLTDPRVRRLLNSGLLSPQHGDLGAENVLVDLHARSWRLVDLDQGGWLPVWWDIVPHALSVRSAFRASDFDQVEQRALADALESVWTAIGWENVAGLTAQHGAALAAVRRAWDRSARTSHSAVQGGLVKPDPDAFARQLHKQVCRSGEQLAHRGRS